MESQTTDSPASKPRGGRSVHRAQVAFGVLIGVAAYVAILIAVYAVEERPEDPGDLRPLEFVVFAAIATPVLLIAAGVLAVRRRVRSLGLGLLIGVAAGLIGTMGGCYALL